MRTKKENILLKVGRNGRSMKDRGGRYMKW